MSRVELYDAGRAPLTARRWYADGDPGPLVAALAAVPELLETAMPFLSMALGPSALDARTKEIVIVRTSALQECRYCVDTHSVVALDCGLTATEVRALRGTASATNAFPDPREAALLAWVDAVAGAVGPVADATANRLAANFAGHEVVELTLLTGAIMMLNRFCTALDLPLAAEVAPRLAAAGLS